jgi:hypothetical protein
VPLTDRSETRRAAVDAGEQIARNHVVEFETRVRALL